MNFSTVKDAIDRFIRLFAFCLVAQIGALHGAHSTRSAIIAVIVGAAEAAFSAAFPGTSKDVAADVSQYTTLTSGLVSTAGPIIEDLDPASEGIVAKVESLVSTVESKAEAVAAKIEPPAPAPVAAPATVAAPAPVAPVAPPAPVAV